MMKIALQISPEAGGAYFKDYVEIAKLELETVFPGSSPVHRAVGTLDFLVMDTEEDALVQLMRLSFAQGIYAVHGEHLEPLDVRGDFGLHEDFVFGTKYRGKTNARLTQMLINVGLAAIGNPDPGKVKLLDPMCGRATTLLWAMRYGMASRGIEHDPKALEDIRRNIKKWTKLHRVKHSLKEGTSGRARRGPQTKYMVFKAAETDMRVYIGDSRDTQGILKEERFDLIVADLPYGVQHFTTNKTRNPLKMVEACLDGWKRSLKDEGALIISFNNYNPKRDALLQTFERAGFWIQDFTAPHRMSESIVRDVAVFKHKVES